MFTSEGRRPEAPLLDDALGAGPLFPGAALVAALARTLGVRAVRLLAARRARARLALRR